MIRVFAQYVPARTVLEMLTDAVLLTLAALLAGFTLDAASPVGDVDVARFTSTLVPSALFAGVMMVLYLAFGAYQHDRPPSVRMMLLCAALASVVASGPLYFAVMRLFLPHRDALRFIALADLYQMAGIVALRQPLLGRWSEGLWSRKVLVVGTGQQARAVAAEMQARGRGAYRLVGFYPAPHETDAGITFAGTVFSPGRDFCELVDAEGVEDIVIAVREQRGGALPLRALLECRTRGIPVHTAAAFSERLHGEMPLDALKASWLIYGGGFSQGLRRTVVKRVFDIVTSLTLLALAWPLMMLAALAIFLEDGAPVLFHQERTGQGGRSIRVVKFRSMRTDAEKDGVARWAQPGDSRVTRVGRWIRKTRIDELPQLFNVLVGDMSLVGPRPERPTFVLQLTEAIPFYAIRHSVKPGLTGWAQVRYAYGASLDDARRKLQFDLYYVKHHSLLLDLRIILETIRVVLLGEGAR